MCARLTRKPVRLRLTVQPPPPPPPLKRRARGLTRASTAPGSAFGRALARGRSQPETRASRVAGGFRRKMSDRDLKKQPAPGLEDRRAAIIKMATLGRVGSGNVRASRRKYSSEGDADEQPSPKGGRLGRRGSLSDMIAQHLAALGAATPQQSPASSPASGRRGSMPSPGSGGAGPATPRRKLSLLSGTFAGGRAPEPRGSIQLSETTFKGGRRQRRGTLCDGTLQSGAQVLQPTRNMETEADADGRRKPSILVCEPSGAPLGSLQLGDAAANWRMSGAPRLAPLTRSPMGPSHPLSRVPS